jgi:hypothetical protein
MQNVTATRREIIEAARKQEKYFARHQTACFSHAHFVRFCNS